MNCRDIAKWLLAADSVTAVPGAMRGHLKECARCRRRRQRVHRLNRAVATLPLPADNPAARARILEKIAEPAALPTNGTLPATLLPLPDRRPAPVRGRWRWRSLLARAAMILVIVGGFGWLTWYTGDPQPQHHEAPAEGEEELLVKLIESHLHLAKGDPEKRFQVLVDMAGDLRTESLRLASADAEDELFALVDLYERVVNEGLVARAHKNQWPEHQVKALRLELRRTQTDADRAAAGASPKVAAALHQLAAAARTAENALKEASTR
jgi:hypothetical protein